MSALPSGESVAPGAPGAPARTDPAPTTDPQPHQQDGSTGPRPRQEDGSTGPSNRFTPFPIEDVEQSIPSRFEAQARAHGDRLAVRGPAGALGYADLNGLANRIARAILATRGPGEEPVGLLLEKDALLMAALLGVLKAGKFYLPLDPSHPGSRSLQILEDAEARLVVTDAASFAAARGLAGPDRALLNVETLDPRLSGEDIDLPLGPEALAYVIYTSGSTGAPKGVVQNHRNVLHNIRNHTNSLHIAADDRLTLLASFSTGQAATDIYCALLNGASLHPFDLREKGLTRLADWLHREKITIYHSSASILHHLLDGIDRDADRSALRLIKVGSEPVSREDVERCRGLFSPDCIIVNALSSTEAGTVRQIFIGKETKIPSAGVPVGYPVEGKDVLLLDESGRPVGFDSPGEIVIRSPFLAVGYWRRPDMTREAFVPDPEGGPARYYRTGDMGRMAPDGCLVYLGRKDHQVKIRGFRVELAEVEAAIADLDSVKQAAVVAIDDDHGNKKLVAHLVPAASPPPPATLLRESLLKRLPDHMVPAEFIATERLPLTPSGKLDRTALASIRPPKGKQDTSPIKPRSPQEWRIAEIWEEILGVRPVGLRDDFFALGGHSLLAVRMLDRIAEVFDTRLPLRTLFSGATVEHLAEALLDTNREMFHSPLLPIQSDGTKTPFYFLHGDWFGGFYCRDIARHLGQDQPFFALLPHGIDGQAVPRTVEEMAADHVRTLLAHRPTGPYFLGGYCNGGIIAFEMARQMRKKGIKVDLVISMDAPMLTAGLKWPRRIVALPGFLLRLDRDDQVDWSKRLLSFVTRLRGLSHEGVRAQASYLSGLMKRLAMEAAGRRSRPRRIRTGDALAPDLGWQYPLYRSAIRGYVPKRYGGRIVFFRSEAMDAVCGGDPSGGWGAVTDGVDVHYLPGRHVTFLTEHVATLAEYLSDCLDKANAELHRAQATANQGGEGDR